MTEIITTSPAYDRTQIDGINRLDELPWCGKINLRGDAGDHRFRDAVKSVFGADLPVQPNTRNAGDPATLYWLGPNEWLCHCAISEVARLLDAFRGETHGLHRAVTDVSDYYTMLRLDGPDAADLLAKSCPLDLHPSVFPAESCAQTRFGHASILLHKLNENPAFDIQVRWSFTEYVWDYLVSAMQTVERVD